MLKSTNLVDAIKEIGQQITDYAKAFDGCPVIQHHVLPHGQFQELADACEGKIPFTFRHLQLYYLSYVGKYPDCDNCPQSDGCERAK